MIATLQAVELPVTLVPGRRWSDDELLQFCADNRDLRIERMASGEIVMMSPAGSGTGNKELEIGGQLWVWTKSDGRGISFSSSTGYTLPDGSMMSPDASWMRRERWDALDAKEQNRFAPVCPEFVIELRSPSDTLPKLRVKMRLWIANGAELGWLIDPQTRIVEVFRRDRESEVLELPSTVKGEGPVTGFTLELDSIWR